MFETKRQCRSAKITGGLDLQMQVRHGRASTVPALPELIAFQDPLTRSHLDRILLQVAQHHIVTSVTMENDAVAEF